MAQKISFITAIFSVLNPRDIFEGFGMAINILAGAH
jgi:hypothetical protein